VSPRSPGSLLARWRERWSGLPAEVRDAVPLGEGERLLAWALTPDGAWVATNWRLFLPAPADREPLAEPAALDWDRIDKATWANPVLTIVPSSGAAPLRVRLDEPGDLPATVRARVTQSVAFSRRESLAPLPGGLRVVGRRSPRTRELRWEILFDPRTPVDDPAVQARADQLLVLARTELAGDATL
jgi:hypothetical protein